MDCILLERKPWLIANVYIPPPFNIDVLLKIHDLATNAGDKPLGQSKRTSIT